MENYPFDKKPAFFASLSAEVFFEAELATDELFKDVAVDAELDALLNQ